MARLLAEGMKLIFLSQLVVERGKACRVRLIKVIFMTEIKLTAQPFPVEQTLGQRNAVALEHGVAAPRKV